MDGEGAMLAFLEWVDHSGVSSAHGGNLGYSGLGKPLRQH